MQNTIKKKNKKYSTSKLQETGERVRDLSIEMSARSKSGETGSSLSISDILAVLYFDTLNINPKKPKESNRDRFILSKGHGAAALYATLALRGFFPLKKLEGHRVNKGFFHAHPSRSVGPWVEASTGSLGHGLSIGVGMAKAIGETKDKNKVYVLIGDGECNEGSIWEAVMFAGHHKLSNIVAIIDANGYQGFDSSKEVSRYDLGKQWEVFGWKVLRASGHDSKDLASKFNEAKKAKLPVVVVADTVAGKGIPRIENTLDAHYCVPNMTDISNKNK